MKKVLFVLCLFAATGNIFAVGSNNQKRFVKGTVADKTEAVRSASDKEILDLAKAAIEFSVNYKDLLGEDPELAELVISGIECLPYEYLENASTAEKTSIANRLLTVYGLFSEAKVRSVVLEKFTNSPLPVENIVTQLNVYVKSVDPAAADPERQVHDIFLIAGKGTHTVDDKRHNCLIPALFKCMVVSAEGCSTGIISADIKNHFV